VDKTPLTDAQRSLVPSLGDDLSGFWDLVWLDTDEQHPEEASAGLLDLFQRGYVEVYEFEPGPDVPEPRVIRDRGTAEAAIRDLSNWQSPPDTAQERWYSAYLTESGFAKWNDDADSAFSAKPLAVVGPPRQR